MKKLILLTLFIFPGLANAQFDKIWEVQHAVGNDSLEVLFNKKDSAGNLYVGGIIGNSYFVTKFNSIGQHQWTRGNNEFIQQLLFPPSSNFEQSVKTSWVSDIAFLGDDLFISGTKCISPNSSSCYNFLLKIDRNGDSLGFIHVLKPDTAASFIWVPAFSVEPYPKSLLTVLDGHIFYFTSLFAQTPEIGNFNVNIFRFSGSLELLKRRAFNGVSAFNHDRLVSVQKTDNNFLIHTLVGSEPRNLLCDTSLSVLWENTYGIRGVSNPRSISPIINDTTIYSFSSLKDTARRRTTPEYFDYVGIIKKFGLKSGSKVDSIKLYADSGGDIVL